MATTAGLIDRSGTPASLEKRDLIYWNREDGTLAVNKSNGDQLFYHIGPKKDDKVYLGPTAVLNIVALMSFIAATHGCTIREVKNDERRFVCELMK